MSKSPTETNTARDSTDISQEFRASLDTANFEFLAPTPDFKLTQAYDVRGIAGNGEFWYRKDLSQGALVDSSGAQKQMTLFEDKYVGGDEPLSDCARLYLNQKAEVSNCKLEVILPSGVRVYSGYINSNTTKFVIKNQTVAFLSYGNDTVSDTNARKILDNLAPTSNEIFMKILVANGALNKP